MIHLTIHTYGYIDLIVHVLNGIAKFRNSGAFDTIVGFTVVVIGTYYSMLMAINTTPEGWKVHFKKMLGVIMFVSILVMPKISMMVKDHVAKTPPRVVDNIPLAFALPVGVMEQWGFVMTKGFEQAFNWSGVKKVNSFSEYGMVFGARLAKDLSEIKMRDPEVISNAHSFIDRCILVRGAIGYPFTLEEVRDSKDLWGLVRTKTKGVITKWTKYENGKRSLENCTQGVAYMDGKLKTEGKDLLTILMAKYHYTPLKKASFLSDISSVFGGGADADAAKLITHHLMLNALDDVTNQYSGMSYGVARAKTQYEANALISGTTATWNLTGMLAMFKVLVYSSFLIVLPLMIAGGGGRRLGMWATTVFSLTLWPPLFAVINMVIDFSYDPAQIISFGALATAQNKYDSIGVVASSMISIVPFLAFWVTRMGEGGIMHMASPIMAAMSGATASAGAEVASNSRSLNNTQIGSESMNNTSSNHHNTNFESVGGESSYNLSDGGMMRITGNNQQVISTGDGINQSKFASPITMRDDMQETTATALHAEESNHKSISASLDKGMSHQEQNVDNYVKGLAKHIDGGGKVSWNSLGRNSQSVQNAVNHELQTGEGYSNRTDETANLAIKASGGFKVPVIGGAGVEGSISTSNSSAQDTSLGTHNSQQEHWSKNFENVVEASANKDFGQSWGADSNLTQDIQSTRSSNIDLRQQEQLSQDKMNSLQQRMEEVKSFGSSYDISATHLVADRLVENGMTQLDAHRLIDNPIRANTEDRHQLNQARSAVRDELMEKISPVSSSNKSADFAALNDKQQNQTQQLLNDGNYAVENASRLAGQNVRNVAKKDGISKESVQGNISNIHGEASNAFNDIRADNAKRNLQTKESNNAQLKAAKNKAKNAQPQERAQNALDYVGNLLKPPKDR